MKIQDIVIENTQLDEAEFNPSRRGFLKKAGAVAASAAMPKGLAGAAMKAVAPTAAAVAPAVAEDFLFYSSPELSKILELLRSDIPTEKIKDIAMKCANEEDTSDFNWGDEGYNLGPIGSNRQMSSGAAELLLRLIDNAEKNKNYDWVNDIVDEVEPAYVEAWEDDLSRYENGEMEDDDEWYELLDTAEMDIFPPDEEAEEEERRTLARDNDEDENDEDDDENEEEEKRRILARDKKSDENYKKATAHWPEQARALGVRPFTPEEIKKNEENYKISKAQWKARHDEHLAWEKAQLARTVGAKIGQTAKQYIDKNVNDVKSHVDDFYNKPAALPAPTVNTGMKIPKQKSKVSVTQKDDGEDDKELERLKEMIRRV